MEHQEELIRSGKVLDFLTIANEYCLIVEESANYPRDTLLGYLQRILPLLYLKGSLLPEVSPPDDDLYERFVTEEQWENCFNDLRKQLDKDDVFWHIPHHHIDDDSGGKNDPEPEAPREPYRIMRDVTVEGIRRAFRQGVPSQGAFTAEAAMMLGGHAMNDDNRAKSAGNFNSLWDNGEISVARGTDGRLQLYDRRLSLHWLVQPDVAFSALHDPMLANIGFWPRFLLACPAPSPPLLARRFEPGSYAGIRAFWNRCEELLAAPLGEDCSSLTVISPTPEAEKLACRFFEKMQQEAKTSGGELVEVKPFAVRATEQAFRIAGVLSAYSGSREIDVDTMRRAILLAGYSLDNWRLAFGDREENAARQWARLLFDWLLKQPDHRATGSAMLQVGPKQIRSKAKRDTALALLQQAGLVDGDMGGYCLCGVEP